MAYTPRTKAIRTLGEDSPATRAFFKYLQEASAHEAWMQQGVFLTAHKGADLSAYATPLLRKQGEILANATTFRFDASDLMPGAIGAGAFWSEMTAFANGQDAKRTGKNKRARPGQFFIGSVTSNKK